MSAKVLGGRCLLAPLVVGEGRLEKCLRLPRGWLTIVVRERDSTSLIMIDSIFSDLREEMRCHVLTAFNRLFNDQRNQPHPLQSAILYKLLQ